jgi:hypothetical protein
LSFRQFAVPIHENIENTPVNQAIRATLRAGGVPPGSAAAGRSAAPSGCQSDGLDEVVDLAIALPVDHPPGIALCRTGRGSAQAASLVAVLDRLDVPEVAGQAVELGAGRAHW